MTKFYNCIDAGSKYCPCNLAHTMNCISCSHLRGEEFCDCNWNGVCILYEYYMGNKQTKAFRKSYTGSVVDRITIEKNLFLLKIQLDRDLLKELNRIGSYIFIKKFEDNNYYETPMSIFNIDEDHIYIIYQEVGPKTKTIKYGNKLTLRGPYWNGIIGEFKLSTIKNSNILIVARGIGQSSILLPIKKLSNKNNNITLILDKGKLNSLYCLDYIYEENINVEIFDPLSIEGEKRLKEIIKDNYIDIVLSSGAEILHRKISNLIETNTKLFVTNNNIFCCGEGICGSCIRKIKDGAKIKTCKTMIDPKKIY
jgi:dihydroorotate dehydrogenase electron transfer subunit